MILVQTLKFISKIFGARDSNPQTLASQSGLPLVYAVVKNNLFDYYFVSFSQEHVKLDSLEFGPFLLQVESTRRHGVVLSKLWTFIAFINIFFITSHRERALLEQLFCVWQSINEKFNATLPQSWRLIELISIIVFFFNLINFY